MAEFDGNIFTQLTYLNILEELRIKGVLVTTGGGGTVLPGYASYGGFERPSESEVMVLGGTYTDDTAVALLTLPNPTVADIEVTGPGGLQTGSSEASNTWYGVYAIGDTSGTNPDNILLIPDGTAFSESGYDIKRRIGWVRNRVGNNFRNFTCSGTANQMTYIWSQDAPGLRVLQGGTATTWTDVDCSPIAPPTCRILHLQVGRTTTVDTDNTVFRENGRTHNGATIMVRPGFVASVNVRQMRVMACDDSQLIEYEQNAAGGATEVIGVGFTDNI